MDSRLKTGNKVIMLVDMNAFYASVHQACDPKLRGKPVIVGGDAAQRRGIVLAKSYEALAIGPVRTAMTLREAMALVPQAIVVRPDHDLYAQYAKRIRRVLQDFSPWVEPNSIDEAYLDMSGSEKLFGTPHQAAGLIQERIRTELGLPCSIGIGRTRICAKMAADFKKPMGITTLWPDDIEQKMHPLPVGKLHGVGKKSAQRLRTLAMATIGDLAVADRAFLLDEFGAQGAVWHDHANGLGDDSVDPERWVRHKSVGHSRTFDHDLTQADELRSACMRLAEQAAWRMRRQNDCTGRVSVSLKDAAFRVRSHSRTLPDVTDLDDAIVETACALLEELWQGEPVRLVGVSLERLEPKGTSQISLFADSGQEALQETMDALRERFGEQGIRRGRTL